MKPFTFRTLISLSLNNSQHLHKPPTLYSFPIFFYYYSSSTSKNATKINLADYLINQHNFSPESALKASTIKSYLKNPENSNSVLSFLKENGFSNTHIEKIVAKTPNILAAKIDTTLKPKIKIFQEFGFSSSDIADIISAHPWILIRSADDQLQQSLLILKGVLGSNADVCKVSKKCGWFLKCDLEKTLMPNIEFLKSCGISCSRIVQGFYVNRFFFVQKPGKINNFVQRVDDMGFDRNSRMFLRAILTISSMTIENWECKLKVFRSLEFSEVDILSMFRRMPTAFSLSEKKIRETTKMLLSRGNVDISFIVNNPSLLLCSIETCLKPRLIVYDTLKTKNLLPKKAGLATICKMSKRKFLDRFVLPYQDELGDLSFQATAHSH